MYCFAPRFQDYQISPKTIRHRASAILKKSLLFAGLLFWAIRLPSQTNESFRLALISESDLSVPAADILAAQFSANSHIHLLERNEIEKVYREQALSRANQDYLKLGRILGADGLLLMKAAAEGARLSLDVRLVAVMKDTSTLDEAQLAERIDAMLPKFMLPRYIEFCESLPKTLSGKVEKFRIVEASLDDSLIAELDPPVGIALRIHHRDEMRR